MTFRSFTLILIFKILLFSTIGLKAQQQSGEYEKIILRAEQYFDQKNYKQARIEYENAIRINPESSYPKLKLNQIRELLPDPDEGRRYNSFIAEANRLMGLREYTKAREQYFWANVIKPEESLPVQKMKEIDATLVELSRKKELYNRSIKTADSLFKLELFQDAQTEYLYASGLLPDEPYARNRINEINSRFDQARKQQSNYEKHIENADQLYMLQDYEAALQAYSEAIKIKPDERYPQNMIERITSMGAEQRSLETVYGQVIENADRLFNEAEYDASRAGYEHALRLKPEETYPSERIAEIERRIEDLVKSEADYISILENALRHYENQEYAKALTQYRNAEKIKALDSESSRIVHEITGIIEAEKKYNQALADADNAFNSGYYQMAIEKYTQVLDMKPENTYPAEQITKINEILANLADQEKAFNDFVAKADESFADRDYEQALGLYQQAGKIKPEEKHPQERIESTKAVVEHLAKASQHFESKEYAEALVQFIKAKDLLPLNDQTIAKIAETEKIISDQKSYAELKTQADELFESGKYEQAIEKYEQSLKFNPEDTYATGKITEINNLLEAIANKEKSYADAISKADESFADRDYEQALNFYQRAGKIKPEEKHPQERIESTEAVVEHLAKASQHFESKEYAEALEQFNEAKALLPLNDQTIAKIAETEKIISDQKSYTELKTQADELFESGKYEQAKEKYEQSLKFNPEDTYATGKITEINNLLEAIANKEKSYADAISKADESFTDKDYEQALGFYQQAGKIKPEEKHPQERIESTEAVVEHLAKASQHFELKEYAEALEQFNEAKALLPLDDQTIAKIAETEKIISDQKSYAELKTQADELFESAKYEQAKEKYEQSLTFNPEDTYATEKISEISNLLEAIANKEKSYADAISKADEFFADKDYEQALGLYQQAGKIKPEEKHPQERTESTEAVVEHLAKASQHFESKEYAEALEQFNEAKALLPLNDQTLAKIAETEKIISDQKSYTELKTQADELFESAKYEQAKEKYEQSLTFNPEDTYATEKITEINNLLEAIAEKEKNYSNAISIADKALKDKEYNLALENYNLASSIKPDEAYPKNKSSEVQNIIKDLEAKQLAYEENIATADSKFNNENYSQAIEGYQEALKFKPNDKYAVNRIAESRNLISESEINEAYENAVASAYFHEENKDLSKALDSWKIASNLKPNEALPKSKITELGAVVAAEKRKIQEAFDKLIAEADRNYNSKVFDQAIEKYEEAGKLKPEENYPSDMISQIRKYIAERAIVDLVTLPMTIKSGDEKRFSFKPVDMRVRRNNYVTLTMRFANTESSRFFLNYGLDNQKSGGIVVRNPGGKEESQFIIRVSSQDRWYRVDNNWISIYAEGSDLEITHMRISSGD